jgi:hypothetical protein
MSTPRKPAASALKPAPRKRSFAAEIIAKRRHLIHTLKAKDTTGRWAYYFILVQPYREQAFLKSLDGDGIIDLEDYGKVLASCYGDEPTAEIKQYLRDTYDYET